MNPYVEKAMRMFGVHENDITVRQINAAKKIVLLKNWGATPERLVSAEAEAIADVYTDQQIPMGPRPEGED